jgi:hypothetical protein
VYGWWSRCTVGGHGGWVLEWVRESESARRARPHAEAQGRRGRAPAPHARAAHRAGGRIRGPDSDPGPPARRPARQCANGAGLCDESFADIACARCRRRPKRPLPPPPPPRPPPIGASGGENAAGGAWRPRRRGGHLAPGRLAAAGRAEAGPPPSP